FIVAAWPASDDSSPELCSDETFLRRVHLDLIGVIPTLSESQQFLADRSPDKRSRLIDALLARNADYADHWTPFWEDALGSMQADLQGGMPPRGNYRDWINKSFREKKAYDIFAAELIDPTMPGHKAATTAVANGKGSRIAFVRNETHVDTLQTAAI